MTTDVVVTDGPLPVEETRYGFIWGHVHVERVAVMRDGSAVLYVTSELASEPGIEVRVSPKGRSIRVFKSPCGPELT